MEEDEEDRRKTAFITKYSLFEYLVIPFGFCNAPSTFQRCMEMVFRGLQWNILLVYLDDIIVMSSNFDEHIERLEEVFKRLSGAGLKMKPSKCKLIRKEVLFLDHVAYDDDEFRFNDASTHEGHLRQNGELLWFCNETVIINHICIKCKTRTNLKIKAVILC